MIVSNQIVKLPKTMKNISQAYYQISKSRGVKLGGADWNPVERYDFEDGYEGDVYTLKKVRENFRFREAKREYRLQLKAYKAGLAPRPIKVCIVELDQYVSRCGSNGDPSKKTYLSPALFMRHVDGITLKQAIDKGFLNYREADNLRDKLYSKLHAIGINHEDLHSNNVVCTLKNKKPNKWFAIDYELSTTHRAYKKIRDLRCWA